MVRSFGNVHQGVSIYGDNCLFAFGFEFKSCMSNITNNMPLFLNGLPRS